MNLIPWPFASNDSRVKSSRTLVYKLMVSSPAILLLGIGFGSRGSQSSYQFVESTASQRRTLAAYRDVVREIRKVAPDDMISIEDAQRLANLVIAKHRASALGPLEPTVYGDNSRDGAKGEVYSAISMLSSRLISGAERAREAGNTPEAAAQALKAAEVLQAVKFSDFASLAFAAAGQRRAVAFIAGLEPHLDGASRQELSDRLGELRVPGRTLDKMIARQELLYRDYLVRQRIDPLRIASGAQMMPADDNGFGNAAMSNLLASNNEESELESDRRLGLVSCRETERRIEDLIARLSDRGSSAAPRR